MKRKLNQKEKWAKDNNKKLSSSERRKMKKLVARYLMTNWGRRCDYFCSSCGKCEAYRCADILFQDMTTTEWW